MIKRLRRQLTAFFTITIRLILTLVVIGILVIDARGFSKKTLVSFQNQTLSITSRLQSGTTTSRARLSRLESDNHLVIYIEGNDKPPFYRGSWTPASGQNTLIMRAREAAMSERIGPSSRPISSSLLRNSVFTVTGDCNDTYLESVLVLPIRTGFQNLTLFTCRGPMGFGLYRQSILFFLLSLAGVTMLMSVSWVLVGKSLKPLAEDQKQQNEFIAVTSHELRAPLAVTRSSIFAARTVPNQREKFMNSMDRECSHVSCLVDDIPLLASAGTGHWSLRVPSLNMDTLLISIYERFEPLYQDRGICLKLDLSKTSLLRVCGGGNRLEQIFAVLLDNALRYTPRGRSVSLITSVQTDKYLLSCDRSMVCLTVSGQSCDMDDETRKHIFNRFRREGSAGSHRQSYGLRLSTARELVQLHRGTISVPDLPDGGTYFLIRLPAEPKPHASGR